MRQCIRYLFDFFLHNKDTIAFICQTAYHIFCKKRGKWALRMRRNPDPEIPHTYCQSDSSCPLLLLNCPIILKQEQTPNHLSISCRKECVRANDFFATGKYLRKLCSLAFCNISILNTKIRRLHIPPVQAFNSTKSIPLDSFFFQAF